MAKIKALPVAAAVAAALAATSVSAVEFHGYMRAGFGLNTQGGAQVCYGHGGPDAHRLGRLGDECDTYAELSLSQTVYEKNNESFSVHTLLALGTEEGTLDAGILDYRGNAWQGIGSVNNNQDMNNDEVVEGGEGRPTPWQGQRMSFREAYAKYKMASGTEIWAGNRFYGRKDVHIWDFYYLNGSGYGAGVDNIKVGPGAFAVAVRNTKWHDVSGGADGNNPYAATPQLDIRYNGLALGSMGSLDLIMLVGKANLSDAQEAAATNYNDKTGVSLTAEWTLGLPGGFNKVVAQYSTQGYAWSGYGMNNHLGDGYNIGKYNNGGDTQVDRKSWRLIDHGVVKFGKKFLLGYAGLVSKLDAPCCDTGDGLRYNLAVRPQFMWNDTMSTIVELGYSSVEDPWMNKTVATNKITLAQAWSPLMNGGFWARPQIRVFVTKYGGDERVDWQGGIYKDYDTMFGAQVEAWW